MTDRRAIVTGASSGIGKAIALELTRKGMDVVASARRAASLDEATSSEGAGRLHRYQADLTDPSAVRDLFEYAREEIGPVDTVIHSVGHEYPIALLAQSDRTAVPGAIAALITSPALVLAEALAQFEDGRGGRVILVSSGAAFRALPGRALYSMAKAAVNQLVRSAAAEVAARPTVAVSAILPGRVDTPMQRRLVETAMTADVTLGLSEFRSMDGVSQAEDVAAAVGDLVDREPSALNGHIFRYAAGGWSIVE